MHSYFVFKKIKKVLSWVLCVIIKQKKVLKLIPVYFIAKYSELHLLSLRTEMYDRIQLSEQNVF